MGQYRHTRASAVHTNSAPCVSSQVAFLMTSKDQSAVMDPSLKRTTKTDELEPCACADASAAHSRASSSVSVVRTCTWGVNVVQASVVCD